MTTCSDLVISTDTHGHVRIALFIAGDRLGLVVHAQLGQLVGVAANQARSASQRGHQRRGQQVRATNGAINAETQQAHHGQVHGTFGGMRIYRC